MRDGLFGADLTWTIALLLISANVILLIWALLVQDLSMREGQGKKRPRSADQELADRERPSRRRRRQSSSPDILPTDQAECVALRMHLQLSTLAAPQPLGLFFHNTWPRLPQHDTPQAVAVHFYDADTILPGWDQPPITKRRHSDSHDGDVEGENNASPPELERPLKRAKVVQSIPTAKRPRRTTRTRHEKRPLPLSPIINSGNAPHSDSVPVAGAFNFAGPGNPECDRNSAADQGARQPTLDSIPRPATVFVVEYEDPINIFPSSTQESSPLTETTYPKHLQNQQPVSRLQRLLIQLTVAYLLITTIISFYNHMFTTIFEEVTWYQDIITIHLHQVAIGRVLLFGEEDSVCHRVGARTAHGAVHEDTVTNRMLVHLGWMPPSPASHYNPTPLSDYHPASLSSSGIYVPEDTFLQELDGIFRSLCWDLDAYLVHDDLPDEEFAWSHMAKHNHTIRQFCERGEDAWQKLDVVFGKAFGSVNGTMDIGPDLSARRMLNSFNTLLERVRDNDNSSSADGSSESCRLRCETNLPRMHSFVLEDADVPVMVEGRPSSFNMDDDYMVPDDFRKYWEALIVQKAHASQNSGPESSWSLKAKPPTCNCSSHGDHRSPSSASWARQQSFNMTARHLADTFPGPNRRHPEAAEWSTDDLDWETMDELRSDYGFLLLPQALTLYIRIIEDLASRLEVIQKRHCSDDYFEENSVSASWTSTRLSRLKRICQGRYILKEIALERLRDMLCRAQRAQFLTRQAMNQSESLRLKVESFRSALRSEDPDRGSPWIRGEARRWGWFGFPKNRLLVFPALQDTTNMIQAGREWIAGELSDIKTQLFFESNALAKAINMAVRAAEERMRCPKECCMDMRTSGNADRSAKSEVMNECTPEKAIWTRWSARDFGRNPVGEQRICLDRP